MKDQDKTQGQLVSEVSELRQRVAALEVSKAERNKAGEVVQESEERYRSLVMNIPDVVWTTDGKGRTVFISANIETVYGYTPEEVCRGGAELWLGRVHPDDVEGVKRAYESLHAGGERFDVEYRIQRKDGRWIWLHDRAVATYDRDDMMYADGVFSDITRRKRAEEGQRTALAEARQATLALQKARDELEQQVEERTAELVEANASLREEMAERIRSEAIRAQAEEALYLTRYSIERSANPILWIQPDGRVAYANDAAYRHLGYSHDELQTMTISDFDPDWPAEYWHTEGWQRLKDARSTTFQSRNRRKDGTIVPVEIKTDHLEFEGEEYLFAWMTDISERVRIEAIRTQAEEALKMERDFSTGILDALVDTVFVFDPTTGKPLRWNAAFNKISGYTDKEIASRKAPDDWYSEEDLEKAAAETGKLLKGKKSVSAMSLITKDGRRVPTEYSSSVIHNPEGDPGYIIAVGRDITERKRAEWALRQYADRLQILHEIDQGILAAQSPEAIARAAVTRIRQLIPCQRAGVVLLDATDEEATILAADADDSEIGAGTSIPFDMFQDVIDALRQGKIVKWEDLPSRGELGRIEYAAGRRAFLSVPMMSQDELVGSLNLGMDDQDTFSEEHETIACQMADQLAISIQQARLHGQIRAHAEELEQRVADRTRELSVLYGVAALASQSLDLETTLARSLEEVLKTVRSDAGSIHLLDEEADMLRLAVQQSIPPDVVTRLESLSSAEGLGEWVNSRDEPRVMTDITRIPHMAAMLPLEPLAYVGMPLRVSGRTVGILSIVGGTDQPQLQVEELSLLTSIADQLGVMIESARLRERAERAAVLEERARLARELHDSVTQLLYSMNLFARAGRDAYRQGSMEQGSRHMLKLGDIVAQAIREMRLLLYELLPQQLEREGLIGAIQHRLDAVEGRADMETELLANAPVQLSKEAERELYRIVQEALNNTLKHSGASSVTVQIEVDQGGIRLDVTDDGLGFDPENISDRGGMGLVNMQERAKKLGGTLTILSKPASGTTIRFRGQIPSDPNDLREMDQRA